MTRERAGEGPESGPETHEVLDARLDRALAEAPELAIPAGFAAAVMLRVAREPRAEQPQPRASVGRWVAAVSAAALFLAVFLLTPSVMRASPHSLLLVSVLAVEFTVLVVSVGPWRSGLRLRF